MKKDKAIYFDMDGTIVDLYGVRSWLKQLQSCNPAPYKSAAPLLKLSMLARKLNKLQRRGYTIGIVSWLSKNSTIEYEQAVTKAKIEWLNKHLHSVQWNEIHIVSYGTPKSTVVSKPKGILFDDEEKNRAEWKGKAFDVTNILNVLKMIEE